MSVSTPFAVSSKCVTRSKTNPAVIVENNGEQNEAKEHLTQDDCPHDSVDSKTKPKTCTLETDGDHSSSFSQQSCSSLFDQQEDRLLIQDGGSHPVRRKSLLPLHELPHPSQLRRKRSAVGPKLSRQWEKVQAVEKHVEQLQKKRAAYFPKRFRERPPAEIDTELTLQSLGDFCIPPPLTAPPAKEIREEVTATLPVPGRRLAEEEDEQWFKRHWQTSQQDAGSNKPVEE